MKLFHLCLLFLSCCSQSHRSYWSSCHCCCCCQTGLHWSQRLCLIPVWFPVFRLLSLFELIPKQPIGVGLSKTSTDQHTGGLSVVITRQQYINVVVNIRVHRLFGCKWKEMRIIGSRCFHYCLKLCDTEFRIRIKNTCSLFTDFYTFEKITITNSFFS